MKIYFAGAKPRTKAHPWDDPRVAAGHDLNVMTTFFELGRMSKKKQRKFFKTLGKNKKDWRESDES